MSVAVGSISRQFEANQIVGRGSRSGERAHAQARRARKFDQQARLRIIAHDPGKHDRHAEARQILGDVARHPAGLQRDLAGHIRGGQRRAGEPRFDVERRRTNGK